MIYHLQGKPRQHSGKESPCQCNKHERRRSHPWSGRSPAGRNGNPLLYSCLENSMDSGAWQVHGVAKSWTLLSSIHAEYSQTVCVCLAAQSCPTLGNSMECSPPGSSPGKNTGVGCHFLLQGIFLTQILKLGLLNFRQILYCLSHQKQQCFLSQSVPGTHS